jgi:hypothetical protein
VTPPHTKNPPITHEPADRGFIEHGLRELARNAPCGEPARARALSLPGLSGVDSDTIVNAPTHE